MASDILTIQDKKRYQTNKTHAVSVSVPSNHNSIPQFFVEVPFAMVGPNLLQVGHVVTQLLDGPALLARVSSYGQSDSICRPVATG